MQTGSRPGQQEPSSTATMLKTAEDAHAAPQLAGGKQMAMQQAAMSSPAQGLAASGRKVEKVQAKLGPVEREGSTVRNDPTILAASIWFEDGMAGHIARAPGVDFRLACETARIEVLNDGHSLWQAEMTDDNPYPEPARQDFTAPDYPQGALAPISQLAACLSGDGRARTANANLKTDILLGQRILFAMVQSHLEGGCPVALGEVDPAMVIEARSGQFYA